MAARALTLGVLFLAAVLLVACGDDRTAARRTMDAKFDRLDSTFVSLETPASPYDTGLHLERATQQYNALIRKYADQLGPDEVKQRLADKANEVGPYCLPCVALLDDEAKKY
jgi:hypothetical protein